MLKQVFFSLSAGILAISLWSTPAHATVECPNGTLAETIESCTEASGTVHSADADAGIMPINETDETMPISNCADSSDLNCQSADGSVAQPDKPTGEAESSSEAESADEEESSEPEMWPVYASLGALGATFLLIIIINLVGRKSKK